MRRRLLGLAVLVMGFLLTPVPATAGGWWSSITLDKNPMASGETVVASSSVLFASPEAAGDDLHAYLVRGVDRQRLEEAMTTPDPGDWWTVPPTAIRLADLEIVDADANAATTRATFTVPDVEPGLYGVMFCTRGCVHPVGDVIPLLDVPVHDDPVLTHMIRTLGTDPEAESRGLWVEQQLNALDADLRRLQGDVDTLVERTPEPTVGPSPPAEGAQLVAEVGARGSNQGTVTAQVGVVAVAAFLAGAAATGLLAAVRRRRA